MGMFMISILALVVAVGIIAFPLVFQALEAYRAPAAVDAEYSERDSLLEALAEVDQAYQTGKLSDPDYQALKLQLERQYFDEIGKASPSE